MDIVRNNIVKTGDNIFESFLCSWIKDWSQFRIRKYLLFQ